MNRQLADRLSLVTIAALAVFAIWLYPNLPDPIPTHFNAAGDADDYTARLPGTIMLAAIPLFSLLLFKAIQIFSPKGFRTEEFANVINLLQFVFVLFLSLVAVAALLKGAGYDVRIELLVPAGVGVLFVIIGNYMSKFRKNFFLGIRTPWTLASDEVWARTHRVGGWCFVAAGVLMIFGAVMRAPMQWSIFIAIGIVLIPVAYSFVIYRKLEGFGPDSPGAD